MTQEVRFDDGAAYERMMGVWSRIAGNAFLDWLDAPPGLRWIDIGCGNGAFTEIIIERTSPSAAEAVDPSPGQLAFARTRQGSRLAHFQEGSAMALPFAGNSFDIAAMALVIFFVPEPAEGVAEMARVVKPGGLAAAYAWDMPGGGFPLEPIRIQMREMGIKPMGPPHPEVSSMPGLRELWAGAGFEQIETREITVQRTFADFEEFWSISLLSPSLGAMIAKLPPDEFARLKEGTRARLSADRDGRILASGRANAIKGRVPK
jgi:ubiquinone/menaquinone biosynthesis C-methylase UbiE